MHARTHAYAHTHTHTHLEVLYRHGDDQKHLPITKADHAGDIYSVSLVTMDNTQSLALLDNVVHATS